MPAWAGQAWASNLLHDCQGKVAQRLHDPLALGLQHYGVFCGHFSWFSPMPPSFSLALPSLLLSHALGSELGEATAPELRALYKGKSYREQMLCKGLRGDPNELGMSTGPKGIS